MTETVFGATATIYGGNLGVNGWSFANYSGGAFGPNCTGPTYTLPSFNWGKCAGENITAASAAVYTIASNIQNAQNAVTIYGPNLLKAVGYLTTGVITAAEFFTLLLAFCGPAELLALVAAVGLTICAIVLAFKCANS